MKAGCEDFDTQNNRKNEEVAFILDEGYHRPVAWKNKEVDGLI
ncbi:hypothetical protein [Listeria seeligeri]|nr:hypothetical protein [Listeria seeligeri]